VTPSSIIDDAMLSDPMVKFIKSLFAWALVVLAGYAFCGIVSSDGWKSGFVFLAVIFFLLTVVRMPILLARNLRQNAERKTD
jgi:lipoprotein signal peptidase